jgi:hypothetical protein
MSSVLHKILGSPLKISGTLMILLGSVILGLALMWTKGNVPFIAGTLLGGLLLYILDFFITKKWEPSNQKYWIGQISIVLIVIIIYGLSYLKSQGETTIIFPEGTQKEAIIVFGIKNALSLPASILWKKEIILPESGFLVTSTRIEDLPGYKIHTLDPHGLDLRLDKQFFQETCIRNKNLLVSYYFTPKRYYPYIPFNNTEVQKAYQKVYDDLCAERIQTHYIDTRTIYQMPRTLLMDSILRENSKTISVDSFYLEQDEINSNAYKEFIYLDQLDTILIHASKNMTDEDYKEYLTLELKPIRANFKRINSIEKWDVIDSIEIWESNEGGHANFFYSNGVLEKVLVRHFGETYQDLTEYYLLNGQLSFTFEKQSKYNRPLLYDSASMIENNDDQVWDYDKSEIHEFRNYFYNGKLIRQLYNQDCGAPFAQEYLEAEQQRILTEFNNMSVRLRSLSE